METKIVQVFNANTLTEQDLQFYKEQTDLDIKLFHNQQVNKQGYVKYNYNNSITKIKTLPQNIVDKEIIVLDDFEHATYTMFKHNTDKARDLYDSCKRKQDRFQNMLLQKLTKLNNLSIGTVDCDISPIGKCICNLDSDSNGCIFCGRDR